MDMFNNDPDKWFTKNTFNYFVAMALQHHYQGYAAINPHNILKHIENDYWRDDIRQVPLDCGPQYPGYELSHRMKAARATNDQNTLNTFLESLRNKVYWYCGKILQEQMAELADNMDPNSNNVSMDNPTDTASTPTRTEKTAEKVADQILDTKNVGHGENLHVNGTSADNGASPSPSDSEEAVEVDANAGSSTSGASATWTPPGTRISTPPGTRISTPSPTRAGNEERPLQEYSTLIHLDAARAKKPIQVVHSDARIDDIWRCEVMYNEISKIGLGQTKKIAEQDAKRMICQELGIAA